MNKFLLFKLNALIALCYHIGLLGSWRSQSIEFNPNDMIMAAFVIASGRATEVQKAAAIILLDIHMPGWRSKAVHLSGYAASRNDAEVWAWRKMVLRRDKSCQYCGSTGNLEAHHIVQWAVAPNLRLLPENGVTLCSPCHKKVPIFRN